MKTTKIASFFVSLLLLFNLFLSPSSAAVLNVAGGGTGLSSVPNGYCLSGSSNPLKLVSIPCVTTALANKWTGVQTFSSGFVSSALSTIGNGTQAGGLLVNGGATVTKDFIVQGVGESTFAGKLSIANGIKLGSDLITRFSNIFNHKAFIVCSSKTIIKAGCDYSADGVSDNVEIQAAYNAASALGNNYAGEVWLSSGEFRITAPIRLEKNNVTIRGAGIDATTIYVENNANINALTYVGSTDIMFNSLQAFTIDGNRANNTTGSGIFIQPTGSAHFWDFSSRDVWVKNFSGDGFYSYDGHGFVLDHFLSEYNDGDGIHVDGIDEIEIQNGTIKFNGKNGVTCRNNGCLVQSNEVSDNGGYGIEMAGVSGSVIGNTIYTNALSGVHVTEQPYMKVTNNVIKSNNQHGILVDTSDSLISGNTVFENSQAAQNAYDEINVAHFRANVSNNTIDGASKSRYGINFDASWSDGNIAMNNTIIGELTAPTNDVAQKTTWFNSDSGGTIVNEKVTFNDLTAGLIGNYLCIDPITKEITSGTTCTLSSERFKKDIVSLSGSGLTEVMSLRPVTFNFKQGFGDNGDKTQIGFVAEEAVKIDPRLVPLDKNGAPSGFSYQNYTVILTKAIQELNTKVEGIVASVPLTLETIENSFPKFTQWFAKVDNGIEDFFAGKVHTKKLCIADDSGETCIDRAQLDALILNLPIESSTAKIPSGSVPVVTNSSATPLVASPAPSVVAPSGVAQDSANVVGGASTDNVTATGSVN